MPMTVNAVCCTILGVIVLSPLLAGVVNSSVAIRTKIESVRSAVFRKEEGNLMESSSRKAQIATLQFAEKTCDLGIGPIDGADKLAPHHAIAVNDKSLRPTVRAIEIRRPLAGIAYCQQ